MSRLSRQFTVFLGAAALAAGAIGAAPAEAQYYKGKTITVLVGAGPASGATIMARIVSKNLAASVEGNPDVIVKNLPGGAGSKAQNFLYEESEKGRLHRLLRLLERSCPGGGSARTSLQV